MRCVTVLIRAPTPVGSSITTNTSQIADNKTQYPNHTPGMILQAERSLGVTEEVESAGCVTGEIITSN